MMGDSRHNWITLNNSRQNNSYTIPENYTWYEWLTRFINQSFKSITMKATTKTMPKTKMCKPNSMILLWFPKLLLKHGSAVHTSARAYTSLHHHMILFYQIQPALKLWYFKHQRDTTKISPRYHRDTDMSKSNSNRENSKTRSITMYVTIQACRKINERNAAK